MSKKVKFVIFGALLAAGLLLAKTVFFPSPYDGANWFKPAGRGIHFAKYSFAKYNMPETYRLVSFRQDERYRHALVLYENRVTKQLFVLFVLKGYSTIDLDNIKTDSNESKPPFWKAARHPFNQEKHAFSVWHYLPFGYRDDFEKSGKDLIIKGIELKKSETINTPVANGKYLAGIFDKLEFKKSSDSWRSFVPIVLDFAGRKEGAVAILNENKSGETTFAVGANSVGKFDKNEFGAILNSITFEGIPAEDYQMEFRAYREKMQKELSGRELDEALAEYVNTH